MCLVLFLVQIAAITASRCPTWFIETNEGCKCGAMVRYLTCNEEDYTVKVMSGDCVTFDSSSKSLIVGDCPYSYHTNQIQRYYYLLPNDTDKLNEALCGPYNRRHFLCGKCINRFGPAIYSLSLQCANCSHISAGYAFSLYLILTYLPIAVVFLVVTIFHFNITSGPLLAYVIYCQVYAVLSYGGGIYASVLSHVPSSFLMLSRISLVLSDVWTLSFFRYFVPSFCLSDSMSNIHVHMLSLGIPLSLVLLMVVAYTSIEIHAKSRNIQCFCKPLTICFTKFNNSWNVSDSLIHAFATFMMLSSYIIMLNICGLFIYSEIYNINGTSKRETLFIDPEVTKYNTVHIVCIVIAVAVCLPLAVCPALLLCLYPTRVYEKASRCLSPRKRIAIKIFVEALHSCFKDGLNGTRDYRMLAGCFFNPILVCVTLYLPVNKLLCEHTPISRDILEALLSFILSFFLSHMKPCKSPITNISISFLFLLFGVLCITSELWQDDFSINTEILAELIVILSSLPHILILIWVGYKVTCSSISLLKIVPTKLRRAALYCSRKMSINNYSWVPF